MTTEPTTPLIFNQLISSLFNKLWYFDESTFIGRIDSLDVVGTSIKAEKSGSRGILYVSTDKNLDTDNENSVSQVSGEFVPSGASEQIPQNVTVLTQQGNTTWESSSGKLTFNTAGTYNIECSVSSVWDTVDAFHEFCYLLKVKHYNSVGTLQSTVSSMAIYYASQDESLTAFSRYLGILTASAGDYLLLTVYPAPIGTSYYPSNVKISLSVHQLNNYV